MDKMYFFMKLNPVRADFVQTMTEEEKTIMQQHAAYWVGHMNQGKVVVFGPVFDPRGAFGMGVVAVESEEEVKELIAGDPALKLSGYDYFPMRAVLPQ